MRIFDKDKTTELSEYDLENGYLKPDKTLIASHPAVEGVEATGHFEVVAEYPNGGKDFEWVIDTPAVEAKEAWDEYEDIQVYIPYTEAELAKREIWRLKGRLNETDYIAIKYAEGLISVEDYAETKAQRQEWRDKINELERICHR